ncbi:hypothetical protein J7K50_09670 [bacterium]|nr:hypothetical protein [bacterium]
MEAMNVMSNAYWACLLLGGGYTLIQFIMLLVGGVIHGVDVDAGHDIDIGHDFDADHDIDIGHDFDVDTDFDADVGLDHDFDTGDPTLDAPGVHDAHGAAATGASDLHVGPYSPMSIAIFLAGFGGMGLVSQLFDIPNDLGVPAAFLGGALSLLFGILASAGLIFTLNKFFEATSSSSGYSEADVIGSKATVSVPMDGKAMGEITYVAGFGTRNSPARPFDKDDSFKQGQEVWIAAVKNGVFKVVDLNKALSMKIKTDDDPNDVD